MEGARGAVQAMADDAGVTLIPPVGGMRVCADRDRIGQTLINLFSNAIKFSPRGSTVSVWDERAGDEVVLKVRDEGRGIPGDQLEAVFERFRQVDGSDAREHGGTGLGLAICRTIVAQHGGADLGREPRRRREHVFLHASGSAVWPPVWRRARVRSLSISQGCRRRDLGA